jgi:RNA polymerase sigma factor (sigma-70 family)
VSAIFRASAPDFDRIYQRHAASVYRYAYAVLGNHADAEDVSQQTFLRAYRSHAQGTTPRKPENWLLTIAHNEIRRHFRTTRGRAFEVELDEELAQAAPTEHPDPSFADVVRALQHIPPAQRSALVMREFEGRSYAEIAEVMGVTQSALESLVFRARRSLADELEEALTCSQAEEALSHRLDRRLRRRESRRLKAHLRECPACARFERVQKRQRSLLRGVSTLFPFPASLFKFRGEEVAVAGSGAAAGTTGIAGGLAFKAAAVTAAAAVAGGASYGVAAKVQQPARPTEARAAALVPSHHGVRPAATRIAVVPKKADRSQAQKAKTHKTKTTPVANGRDKSDAVKTHGRGPANHPVKKPHPVTPALDKAKHATPAATRPKSGKKLGQLRPAHPAKQKPAKPPKPAKKTEPPATAKADAGAPAEAHGRGSKKPPSDPGSSGTAPASTAYPASPAS